MSYSHCIGFTMFSRHLVAFRIPNFLVLVFGGILEKTSKILLFQVLLNQHGGFFLLNSNFRSEFLGMFKNYHTRVLVFKGG